MLRKLIRWGAASLEKSLNVPRLPHAVLVLNMTDVEVDEWNPDLATIRVLESFGAYTGLGGVPEFQDLAKAWKNNSGTNINSAYDLLRKYYSSFTVVRVPDGKGRFNLLDQQVAELQRVISSKCNDSIFAKKQAHMPITSDGVHRYLQAGFDHFSRTLEEPFDFIKERLENNPPPEDFADHIWALALLIR